MATVDSITIINTLLGDINAVVPNFTSLVSSYRLLVGAAEEVQRTPGVPFEIFERAVIRYDRTGTLIDLLLELLCCKIAFITQFLAVTCAPVDIFRLLEDCCSPDDPNCRTAETIIILEALRQVLGRPCSSCFGPPPGNITEPHLNQAPATPPPAKPGIIQSDLETEQELTTEVTPPPSFTSPLTRRHI
jgi:hypothetical protein